MRCDFRLTAFNPTSHPGRYASSSFPAMIQTIATAAARTRTLQTACMQTTVVVVAVAAAAVVVVVGGGGWGFCQRCKGELGTYLIGGKVRACDV